MGERQWPGDDIPDGAYTVSFTWNSTAIKVLLRILRDGYPSGYTSMVEHVRRAIDARPLVVIDPEDREQVERLVTLYCNQFPIARGPEDDEAMADALREFANPKPPQCGAVLNLAGAHHRCEGEVGHDDPHHNRTAEAIWGERP